MARTHQLNFRALRAFHETARLKSYSAAAQALHITQPAVSKAVRQLEEELGLPLIERSSAGLRAFRLTAAGAAVYDHARGIFAMEYAALDAVRAHLELDRGQLAIGASTTVASYWLPPLVARFAQQHPGIATSVVVANTESIAGSLRDCRIDLALVEGPVDSEHIEAERWKDEDMVVVAPQAASGPGRHGRREMAAQTWVLREHGSGTRVVTERLLAQIGVTPAATLEAGSNEAVARLVAEGAGWALLPAALAEDFLVLGRIRRVRLGRGPLTRPLYLLRLKHRPLSPAATRWMQLLGARDES